MDAYLACIKNLDGSIRTSIRQDLDDLISSVKEHIQKIGEEKGRQINLDSFFNNVRKNLDRKGKIDITYHLGDCELWVNFELQKNIPVVME